jgi:4-amino-4-deoxy-L-arabinose transferase-like glycosyltransferase
MKARPILTTVWVSSICVFAALHFVHLQADFPNYSRWMDYSKYTDEGWYANAAVEHYLRGSWYVPGDFNTAPAVPVWPILEWIVFHFTGVSIAAARALVVSLFCCNLLLSYKLVRRDQPLWVALFSATLIVTSSFLYCFGRLAILEPLLVCLTLTSLLLARRLGDVESQRGRYSLATIMGVVFCLMVLTKTTAVFLIPAILYFLWYPLRRQPRTFLTAAGTTALVAGTLWCSYFFLLVRPHYLADYHYFFRINIYPKPTKLLGWLAVFYYAVHGILWVNAVIVLTSVFLLATTLLFARSVWRSPLFMSSILAIGGYFLFITDIDNMQPRYYAVIAFFVFFIVPLASAALLKEKRVLGVAALVVIVAAAAKSAWEVGGFMLYPEYTFVNAARGIADYVDKHPNGNRLIVSISGNDISLIAGVPSLCDDFGTINLPDKLEMYKPGWYAAWDDLDAGTVEDLHTHYGLQQAASFSAFDDDDRDTLVLYKLIPRPEDEPKADLRGSQHSD